ncbi:hypothetical protein ACHAXT_000049 [Thalassiosira profunda]
MNDSAPDGEPPYLRADSPLRASRSPSGRLRLRSADRHSTLASPDGRLGRSDDPMNPEERLALASPDRRPPLLRSHSSRVARSPSGRLGRPDAASPNRHAFSSPDGDGRSPLRSPSSRLLRSSSSTKEILRDAPGSRDKDGSGEISEGNAHLQLKNYRPLHHPGPASEPQSATFFVMVTGQIESAKSSSPSLNDHLYCRYSFSSGPDWEVVHGVSMGLSQVGRQGLATNSTDDGGNVVVWNFPIEISFQSTNPQGWPRLALSVYGFDFLGRDVIRGYSSLLLPVFPGRHTRYLKTYRPVSGSKFTQCANWLMGTSPEFFDPKFTTRGEGRAVTRVASGDHEVKVNLTVTVKDMAALDYAPSTA